MEARRQQRVAANQARFREMNERIANALSEFRGASDSDLLDAMCECRLSECSDMLALARGEYDRIRTEPAWFIVRPEHLIEQAERVVEQHQEFWVIARQDQP